MLRLLNHFVSREFAFLLVLESCLIMLCLWWGARFRFWNNPEELELYTVMPQFGIQIAAAVVCCMGSFYYHELYSPQFLSGSQIHLWQVARAVLIACVVLVVVGLCLPALGSDTGQLLISFALILITLFLAHYVVAFACRTALPREKVLILGNGKLAQTVADEIRRRSDLPIEVVGFLGNDTEPRELTEVAQAVIGNFADLTPIAHKLGVSRIVIGVEERRDSLPMRELVHLRAQGIQMEDAQSALEALTGRVPIEWIKPGWFVFSTGFNQTGSGAAVQRALQLIATVGLIILLGPVMLVTGLAVLLSSGRPIFYRQVRVGINGKLFELLKFRTMRTDAEADGKAMWAVKNDPRVTPLGKWLRKYRLDELPQLLCVIRGDMNLIGPRPERPAFVKDLSKAIPFYDERHAVRPGVTGWSQVCYPYGASVADSFQKLQYDLFYIKNMSLLFDWMILLKTVKTVCLGRGAQ